MKSRDSPNEKREWWDSDEESHLSQIAARDIQLSSFELDVPEHLPNSLLCTLNSIPPSGGNGICVYHGRRKSTKYATGGGEDDNAEY
jgi:hypothetical protein